MMTKKYNPMKLNMPKIAWVISFLVIATGMQVVYADNNPSGKQGSSVDSINDYITMYSKSGTVDNFKENDFKITHNPTVCAVEENKVNGYAKHDLTVDTWYSVLDWSTKLNEEYGKHGPWHISYKKIPYQDSVKFNPQCDVTVRFFGKISSDDLYFVGITSGGVTYYDYNQHRAYVKILYDDMTLPQIQGVITHELGHALGLGHYVTSTSTLERIASGLEDSPSIMVGVVSKSNHYSITPIDVAEMKTKYGSEGFQSNTVYYSSNNAPKNMMAFTTLNQYENNIPKTSSIVNHSGKFLSSMISDDVSDGTSFIGTGSVLVKDLIMGGYLTIPDSINQNKLTYELPISIRYHIVNAWTNGDMTDEKLINSLNDLIKSGKLDLTKHYSDYDAT